MRLIRTAFLLLSWALLLHSCAQIKSPTGGAKDETPPQLTGSQPALMATGFNDNKITLSFDEYIKLSNVSEQVVISPPLDNKPDIEVKGGDKIVIQFEEKLQDNTTYTINFGEAIADNNEGNVLKENTFLFSTGDYIDSLSLSGTLLIAETDEACQNCLALLFSDLSDSAIYNARPYYVSKSDKEGKFLLPHLKEGEYDLIALMDLNRDLNYDKGELLGFESKRIVLNGPDSLAHTLRMFREEEMETKLTGVTTGEYKESITLTFNRDLKELQVKAIPPSLSPSEIMTFERRDSVQLWFSAHVNDDPVELIISDAQTILDTLKVSTDKRKMDIPPLAVKEPYLAHVESTLLIKTTRPVLEDDVLLMSLKKDSIDVPFTFERINSMEASLDAEWEEEGIYELLFSPAALSPLVGPANDSLLFKMKCPKSTSLGKVIATLSDSASVGAMLILRCVDKKGAIKDQYRRVESMGDIVFDYLKPATYRIDILYDLNGNGKWDTGDYMSDTQAELVETRARGIQVKGNWEIEIDLD